MYKSFKHHSNIFRVTFKRHISHISITFDVPKGSLVAVIGDVGSGKTALISALLGEMKKLEGHVFINGSVAFVSQLPWIQNLSLKDNVLFEKPYNQEYYRNVIKACALLPDLQVLPDGDNTEIGEKGINLSGGQKQRVNLARAVYSDADIYLLDDPLSAVDSHVAEYLFKNVLGPSGLLSRKTRFLVTNNLKYLPFCDRIICLKNGVIDEMGSFIDVIKSNNKFSSYLQDYIADFEADKTEAADEFSDQLSAEEIRKIFARSSEQHSENTSIETKESKCTFKHSKSKRKNAKEGKVLHEKLKHELTEIENIEKGRNNWKTVKEYFRSFDWSTLVNILITFALSTAASLATDYWLSDWSDNAVSEIGNDKKRNVRIIVYAVLGISNGALIFICQITVSFGCYKASKYFHSRLLQHIMRASMLFFDVTPSGRIINRFSKDIDAIDYAQPDSLRWTVSVLVSILSTIVVMAICTPYMILMFVILAFFHVFVQRSYSAASGQLRRLESVSRSPIYSHFSETIQGLQTIRAFKAQDRFINRNNFLNDENVLAYYLSIMINRWLGIVLETLANIVVLTVSMVSVTRREKISAGVAGLCISYSMNMIQLLTWLIRMVSEIETNVVAIERIVEYCEIDTEADWVVENNKPPSDWPQKGAIEFKNYALRYRPGLEPALKAITIAIKPNEKSSFEFILRMFIKIGVVGRTGSGKSSLTLGLFRLIEACSGEIIIDGFNIGLFGLHDVRSKLAIIPQDPVLFSGTLRSNFDPFHTYSDDTIWWALKHSHLYDFVKKLDGQLNYEVYDGGENLSAGQKQLVCLARALLRKSKILILDEATASVDLETDNLIQRTIRSEFSDCTILTIAHRLHTVMDSDRIMVVDHGEIKEFDTPKNLLSNQHSLFHKLAHDAGIRCENFE